MDLLTLLLVAFSLSADAFAVAITNGICCKKLTLKHVIATALSFGFFQGFMPTLGFILGKTCSEIISRYHHFVALFLLSAIGINMLAEVYREKKNSDQHCSTKDIFTMKNLILQGIATSIDALAAGVSFAAMEVNILIASALIGIITFLCCSFGVYIGKRFGALLGLRARLVGGILLIIIGLNIFFE